MRTGLCMIIVAALFVSAGEIAWSQVGTERMVAIKATMEQVKAFSQRLPERTRQRLSGGALNLINLAERFDQIEPGLSQTPAGLSLAPDDSKRREYDERDRERPSLEPRQVSDPSTDVAFSSFGGFTQSETATAWCGNNVVVGFNDSGSSFETSVDPRAPIGIGMSFVGFARSTNKGASFTDMRFLNPGPVDNFLGGDPVVRCTDPRTFYFASLLARPGTSDISVSKSTDGGASFGDPVSAVSKDAFSHLLDKPWMDVDPTNPNRIYVTYTDFGDFSGDVCGFDVDGFPIPRNAIELVRSDDGGTTWSAPVAVQEICGFVSFVQGSQVAVGPNGEVYVAWEQITDLIREIDIRKSTDKGLTFGDIVKVDDVTPVGDGFLLQGAFRSLSELPSLAVDRSAGKGKHGSVYIAWHDARKLVVQDPIAGRYGFADVLLSRSTDGGATWSSPVRVNDNTEPSPSGLGTDQYQPGIAVDHTGTVGICFYDRREDANNFLIDRFCAASTDAGASWHNTQITAKSFAAVPGQDFLINPVYMGDYDSLATDFTKLNSGFIGAWGDNSRGNPDVKASGLTTGRKQSPGHVNDKHEPKLLGRAGKGR
jgi:hypothetical protein